MKPLLDMVFVRISILVTKRKINKMKYYIIKLHVMDFTVA